MNNFDQFEKLQRMGETRMVTRTPNQGGSGGNPYPLKVSEWADFGASKQI